MRDLEILNPGQRLKSIRKVLKLRQEELAGDRFSKNYISMFENNRRSINAINATYLAEQINSIAKEKGKDISINASFLLKSNKDMAKDKCQELFSEIENNLELSQEIFNKNLYMIILLSSKYELMAFKAKALYLKGLNSFNRSLLYCATAQLLEATVYSAMENDFQSLYEVYKIIGLSLYTQKQQNQSLIYFNLSENMLEKSHDSNISKKEELIYYKALCYFQLGQYVTAKRIIGGNETEDSKLLELLNEIDMVLTA